MIGTVGWKYSISLLHWQKFNLSMGQPEMWPCNREFVTENFHRGGLQAVRFHVYLLRGLQWTVFCWYISQSSHITSGFVRNCLFVTIVYGLNWSRHAMDARCLSERIESDSLRKESMCMRGTLSDVTAFLFRHLQSRRNLRGRGEIPAEPYVSLEIARFCRIDAYHRVGHVYQRHYILIKFRATMKFWFLHKWNRHVCGRSPVTPLDNSSFISVD